MMGFTGRAERLASVDWGCRRLHDTLLLICCRPQNRSSGRLASLAQGLRADRSRVTAEARRRRIDRASEAPPRSLITAEETPVGRPLTTAINPGGVTEATTAALA